MPHGFNDNKTIYDLNNLKVDTSAILNTVWPVGSVYFTFDSRNPSVILNMPDSTWTRLTDGKYIRCTAGGSNNKLPGATGGSNSMTLLPTHLPAHEHGMQSQAWDSSENIKLASNGYVIFHKGGRKRLFYSFTSRRGQGAGTTMVEKGDTQPESEVKAYPKSGKQFGKLAAVEDPNSSATSIDPPATFGDIIDMDISRCLSISGTTSGYLYDSKNQGGTTPSAYRRPGENGTTFDILPEYIYLYAWRRTA